MDSWLSLNQIANYCDGVLQGDDVAVKGVSTDSRQLHPGEIFVALQGDHYDGHQFIDKAVDAMACGVVVHKVVQTSLPSIMVDDTLQALTRWASNWRAELTPKVVGITGSNGKTTVKQLVSNILSQKGKVCATRGNLNNHIGVPLTLLSLRTSDVFAVIEMGANHHGEIRHLTNIARPDIAILTNAGPAHLEGFGSLDGVAKAKGEIFEGLSAAGIAILNREDRYFDYWRRTIDDRCATLSFGLHETADCYVVLRNAGSAEIVTPGESIVVNLKVPGTHYLYDVAAATAAATAMGLDIETVKAGLESAAHESGRLQLYKGVMGSAIFDDTYNANPASLRAAIEVLAQQQGTRWLVLGDMGELGAMAEQLHFEAGQFAKSHGVDRLFCLGPLSRHAAEGFGEGAQSFLSRQDLAKVLLGSLESGTCILVKGSRAMQMEEYVGLLKETQTVH